MQCGTLSAVEKRNLLLLGVGMVGRAVFDAARETRHVIGVTRKPERLFEFVDLGIDPIVMPWPSAEVIAPLSHEADVLVSFPPDGETDAILAPACAHARCVVYISSTSVYGNQSGTIDNTTAVSADSEAAALRIQAEEIWRSVNATILRAPAIYGQNSGLHIRLQQGNFAIPGDGTGMVSRIHVEDLAQIILSVFDSGRRKETFVVGDLMPATHKEVVTWLCDQLKMPLPRFSPLEEVSAQLRSNRAIDATRTLEELGVRLKYPTYKEGFAALINCDPSK